MTDECIKQSLQFIRRLTKVKSAQHALAANDNSSFYWHWRYNVSDLISCQNRPRLHALVVEQVNAPLTVTVVVENVFNTMQQ